MQKKANSQARKAIKQTSKPRDDNDIYILLIQLALLFDKDWEAKEKIFAFLASYEEDHKLENNTCKAKIDLLHILATFIQKANVKNLVDFSSTSQLNVQEPETYKQAVSRLQA